MNKDVLVKVTGAALMGSAMASMLTSLTDTMTRDAIEDKRIKGESEAMLAGMTNALIDTVVPTAITVLTYLAFNRKK